MKIALLTMGTRGDVQPFAVLGKALKKRGHEVTVASAKNFAPFIQSYGLDFAGVEADFQEVLNSPEGKKMMSNPFSARKHLHKLIYPMLYDSLNVFYNVSLNSDKVLFHVKAMADFFAEHVPGKLIRTNVVPAIEPTKEFINPILSALPLPRFVNRLSFKLSDLGLKMMSKPVNQFRNKVGITNSYKKPLLPALYGISPVFLSQPKDFPLNSYFTGFWQEDSQQELPADVIGFIESGTAPLVITFGSMPFETKMDLPAVLNRLTKELSTRLIIVKGWGLNETKVLEQNSDIKIIESAPYDKLFPRVRAAIHHGGIGTIAACLKAGIPFFTCPVLYPLGDQHFWGTIAFRKGAALKPVALKKLNENNFISAAKELLTNEKLYSNSKRLMEQMKNEDGVKNAVELVETF